MTDQNSQFFAILTAVGEAKQANANALGVPWTFAQMGVGDANNTDPVPSRTQTRLINERRRAPLNQLTVDPKDSSIIIAEQVIPPDVGGWWIREIGLYDSAGDLVAVANCAPSYKPLLAQGTGKTQVVRLNLVVTSSANVQLKIDPSVVLATREFVDGRIGEALDKLDGKNSVRAATIAPITLVGIKTLDGITVQIGDRVLVKDQPQGKDNGVYVVAEGIWPRARDADSNVDVTPGLVVTVEQGEMQADTQWKLVTDSPLILGVTPLLFRNIATSYNGTSPRNTGGAITSAEAGKMIYYYGTDAGQTLTLPSATTLPVGGTINVQNVSTVPITMAKTGTDTIQIGGVGGSIDSLVLYPGSELEFTCVSNYEWFAQGTGALHRMNGLPTLPAGTANGQLATAGFVQQELDGELGTSMPLTDGVPTPGASRKKSREDHRHPTDASRAPLDSPVFTGLAMAPTAPLFDDSATIANTAFVRRHGVQYAGVSGFTAGRQLLATDAGKLLYFAGSTSDQVFTLPAAADVQLGGRIAVQNVSGFTLSVARSNGDFLHVGGEQLTMLSIPPGGEAVFTRANISAWYVVGSATLSKVSSFASLKAANGWERLPSGIIRQWGTAANGEMANGTMILLPTTYPNEHFITVACAVNTTGEIESAYTGDQTLSGFRLFTQSQASPGGAWNDNAVSARYVSLGW